MNLSPRTTAAAARRRAFTLIELMISIALVALLILGVNQVFLYTSQAVGAGEAINDAVRTGRTLQVTLANDLATAVPNGSDANSSACMVISSTAVYAYRNAADLAGDNDAIPYTIDLNGNGVEGEATVLGEVIGPMTYNFRNHRTDTLSFFARGHFPRQTGNSVGAVVANMSADEAWVWYGHARLPDNTAPAVGALLPAANFFGPGEQSPAVNPNQSFAGQFVLARQAMTLRPYEPNKANGQDTTSIFDNEFNQVPQTYVAPAAFTGTAAGTIGTPTLWPLTPDATATLNGPPLTPAVRLAQSRYDLAAGTIPGIRQQLLTALDGGYPSAAPTWWTTANYLHQFECNPFVPKPLDQNTMPAALAQASPYLVRGVSQFTVEFAGDFVTQNNDPTDTVYNDAALTPTDQTLVAGTVKPTDGTYGDVIADGGDGVVDFYVDKTADTSAAINHPELWRRQVRWYGLPRDDNGDGAVNGFAGTFNNAVAKQAVQSNNTLHDVVPVRDVVCTTAHPELLPGGAVAYRGEDFEHFPTVLADGSFVADQKSASGTNPVSTPMANYAAAAASSGPPYLNLAAYVAAFGPHDPRVRSIRITITLEDPTGRLRDGQTYQYVFPVAAKR